MLAKALDASCILSLVDSPRAIPGATTSNSSGYSAKSIVSVEDPDGIYHHVVIDEDDCYLYYAEKLSAFNFTITMVKNEQRPVVIQTFHYACLQKLSFDEAVASLIEMCNNIPIEGLKIAAAITSTEPYCFKFQLDKCTNKKCRFIHQLMDEQQKKESGFDKNRLDMKNYDMKSDNKENKFEGKKDTRNNNSSGTNGMHNSLPLSREHQMQLGEPKGIMTEKNPKGYSKF